MCALAHGLAATVYPRNSSPGGRKFPDPRGQAGRLHPSLDCQDGRSRENLRPASVWVWCPRWDSSGIETAEGRPEAGCGCGSAGTSARAALSQPNSSISSPAVGSQGERAHGRGVFVLGGVHQLVGPLHELSGELSGVHLSLGERPQLHAHHPDIHEHGAFGERLVLGGPVVAFDDGLESLGDAAGFVEAEDVRDQEAEFVAPEARVQILLAPVVRCLAFPGQQIIGSNLLGENVGNALDDSIAHEMADRVVVPLEVRDVDQADRAPLVAPFELQKPFEALHEPREMQERGLGIAMRLIRQLGQHVFEGFGHLLVAGRGKLALQPGHLLDEALGLRVKRFQLRVLDPVALPRDDRFAGNQQIDFFGGPEMRSVRGPTARRSAIDLGIFESTPIVSVRRGLTASPWRGMIAVVVCGHGRPQYFTIGSGTLSKARRA